MQTIAKTTRGTVTATVAEDAITSKIARITIHVMKLRTALLNVSEDNKKAKNPLVFWFNLRNNKMSCHILGHHLSADNLPELLDEAETKVCEIHNELYNTNHIFMDDLTHSNNPEEWSKERLLAEYQKLQEMMNNKAIVAVKKRKYTKRKNTVKNGEK